MQSEVQLGPANGVPISKYIPSNIARYQYDQAIQLANKNVPIHLCCRHGKITNTELSVYDDLNRLNRKALAHSQLIANPEMLPAKRCYTKSVLETSQARINEQLTTSINPSTHGCYAPTFLVRAREFSSGKSYLTFKQNSQTRTNVNRKYTNTLLLQP